MAYAERRGDCYRGRYKNPPGVTPKWGTVSEDDDGYPFARKGHALVAAEDKEAEVRQLLAEWRKLTQVHPAPAVDGVSMEEWRRLLEGLRRKANGGRDPNAGDITLADYVQQRWWPAQDLEPRTVDQYKYRLKHQVLPFFGRRPVNSLIDPEEIAAWERGMVGRWAQSTAADSRSLLTTILGDAKEAGLVDVNAAQRRRGRGRKKNRQKGRRRRAIGKQWATPLEALLVAERCAVLTGQDDDFVMWVTDAWCGLRWGELIGLELDSFRLSKLHVEWQLSELNSHFSKEDPKDGSFRNDDPAFFGAVDLPPFLSALLSDHIQRRPPRACRCPGRECGAGSRLLFLGSDGGHPRRSDYNRRYWRPAADGVYPGEGGKRPRPARPVLVDLAAPWPGQVLRPAWAPAEGDTWEPPRGRGWTRFDLPVVDELAVGCDCGARAGQACTSRSGRATLAHGPRRELAEARGHVTWRAPGSWLPVRKALTPHGLRHALKTWMIEDGIPEVLQHDRLGHVMTGIGATYSHVSPAMREELKGALQERWETALGQRAALSARSAVPLVDALLAPYRKPFGDFVSRSSPEHAKGPLSLAGERASDLGGAEGI